MKRLLGLAAALALAGCGGGGSTGQKANSEAARFAHEAVAPYVGGPEQKAAEHQKLEREAREVEQKREAEHRASELEHGK